MFLLRSAAVGVLVTAMSDEDARVRIKAAEVLLDRGWGKPPQALTVAGDEDGGPVMHVFAWQKD